MNLRVLRCEWMIRHWKKSVINTFETYTMVGWRTRRHKEAGFDFHLRRASVGRQMPGDVGTRGPLWAFTSVWCQREKEEFTHFWEIAASLGSSLPMYTERERERTFRSFLTAFACWTLSCEMTCCALQSFKHMDTCWKIGTAPLRVTMVLHSLGFQSAAL